MRFVPTLGLLVAVALGGCGSRGEGQPAIVQTGEDSWSTAMALLSSSTAPIDESSTGAPASASGTSTSEGVGTSEGVTWDLGVPDFGSAQPLGCGGKIDFLFVISAAGTMEGHQGQLVAAFPGFMNAVKKQLPDFDVQILVANPNPKPGWLMNDCSLSLGTVDDWIEALHRAKHGDEDAFAVLVLTTDIDLGYGQLCKPDEANGTKNRLRVLAETVKHGFVGSICMSNYVDFFAGHVHHLVDLCDEFVPPG